MDPSKPSQQEHRTRRLETHAQVIALVDERDRLRAEVAANQAALQRAIREAREAGWGPTAIAEFVGVTRRMIYLALEAEKSARAGGTAGRMTQRSTTSHEHQQPT